MLAFAVGSLTGSLAVGGYVRHRLSTLLASPEARVDFLVQRLDRELSLDDLQEQEARHILAELQEEIEGAREEFAGEIRPTVYSTFNELQQILSREQSERLQALREEIMPFQGSSE
jgi:polyhydroxyalkanoate synthesis regulator phasin